jgi:tRNA (cytidine/uridine-2'-O-)-methyltransferase
MLHIVLFEPEIPPNTGNIIRLCANTGCALHLVEPLGFDLEDKKMRRAGLDYREYADVRRHRDFDAFMAQHRPGRLFGVSTRGQRSYHEVDYQPGDALVFGPETRGLPDKILNDLGPQATLRIPMKPDSRSLNLSNAVALVAYEALRQQGFPNLT